MQWVKAVVEAEVVAKVVVAMVAEMELERRRSFDARHLRTAKKARCCASS